MNYVALNIKFVALENGSFRLNIMYVAEFINYVANGIFDYLFLYFIIKMH